jgi:hypothetical protein
MVEHCNGLNIPNYDRRMSRFFELQKGISVWYTWPSLVDHADGPSLVKGRVGTDRARARHARVAHTFIGEDASALDVNWSGAVVDVGTREYVNPRMAARQQEQEAVDDGSRVVFRHRATGQVVRLLPTSPRVRRLSGTKAWESVEV